MKIDKQIADNTMNINAEALIALRQRVTDKDQTIGSLEESVKNLNNQISELKTEKNKDVISDDQKVIVVEQYNNNNEVRCQCGNWTYNNICPSCSRVLRSKEKVIATRNLEEVTAKLRKDISKELQIDNIALEDNVSKLSFSHSKLENELKANNKDHEQNITDAKRDVRKSYQTQLEAANRRVEDLLEDIVKLEDDNTDEQVEEARKQEIIDLKERITELEELIEDSKLVPSLRKFWQRITDRKVKLQAAKENLEKQERVDRISNEYPTTKGNAKDKWYKSRGLNPGFMYNWFSGNTTPSYIDDEDCPY